MDRACKLGGNAISLRLERCWSKHSWSGLYDTHVVLTNAAALLGSTNRRRRQVRLACSFISNKCATFLVGRFASPRCRKGSSTLYVRKPVKIFFSFDKNWAPKLEWPKLHLPIDCFVSFPFTCHHFTFFLNPIIWQIYN